MYDFAGAGRNAVYCRFTCCHWVLFLEIKVWSVFEKLRYFIRALEESKRNRNRKTIDGWTHTVIQSVLAGGWLEIGIFFLFFVVWTV